MALVSMKNRPSQQVKSMVMAAEPALEEYPWGLRLCIEHEQLEKLGLKKLPAVGQELTLTAKVVVKSVSSSEREGEEPRRDMSVQITDMALTSGKGTRLYDED